MWWALPSFTCEAKAVNKWSFATLSDAHRPTENAAFERLYRQAEVARDVRYSRCSKG